MASAMSTLLKEILEEDLDAFMAQERVSTDMGGLLRADYKEFHQGCRYYKGAGMDFWQWVRDTHGPAFLVPFACADAVGDKIWTSKLRSPCTSTACTS